MAAFSEVGVKVRLGIEAQMADAACTLVSEGLGVALVPSLISVGWPREKVVFKPIRPKVSMKTWLYSSAFEPVQQLALMLMEEIRKGIEEIENSYSLP